ncbi:MAG: type VI secretion system-associated FHA domain protein TagH [Chromatiales bacterium]|nr:type VI secretion system-associated FHA domain protein TagH [Chromatiales bacterium]
MPLHLRIVGDQSARLGDLQSRSFAACGGTIGRAPDNDWPIPDPNRYLSSRHAIIDFQAGAYYLIDTSRNGVYLNGSDTPVGKGNPQRLFDGDQLRMGDYEVCVEISGNDEDIQDDGMRDSVVRAQLVQEDESMELALVSDEKLLADSALQRHLRPDGSLRLRRPAASAPAALATGAVALARPAPAPERNPQADALGVLLEAAGLDPRALEGQKPEETLQACGRLLRGLTSGLMTLLRDQARIGQELGLPATPQQVADRNPLKLAPSVDEALRLVLREPSAGGLAGEEAIDEVLGSLRRHEDALIRAMHKAARDLVDRLEPEELRRRFDQALDRPALLARVNWLKYWDLYEETWQVVSSGADVCPQAYAEDLGRAYLEVLKDDRRRSAG